MMRSNISRLAVLGLAAISGQVFAAVSLSGQVRLDTKFVSEPKADADSMDLSRVRLNVKGDVSSDWMASLRLEGKDGTVKLERAFASWNGLENTTVKLGKAGHISADADDSYYAPYTTWHGPLSGFNSNDLGVSVAGSMGSFGYNVGLANTSVTDDTPSEGDSLKWSMGARAHFTAMNSDKMAWGVGLGLISRKHADDHVTANDGTNTDKSRFDKKSGMTFDVSGVMGSFAMTAAVYNLKDKLEGVYDSLDDAKTATANNPFAKDAKSNSYYLEGSYLVMGDGYGFGSGVVSGPKFKSSALELGVRLSHVTHKNAAVILNDADVSTASSTDIFAAGDELKVKTNASSLFANYYVNSNAVVKVEYFNSKAKTTNNMLAANPADVKNKHLSIRAQFSF